MGYPMIDMGFKLHGALWVLHPVGANQTGNMYWLCLCDPALGGCGKRVAIRGTNLRNGNTRTCGCWDKLGSNNSFWKDEPSYFTAHRRHLLKWSKTGVCAICDADAKTQWAWINHHLDPGGWSDDREDYVEMCSPCHRQYDTATASRIPEGKRSNQMSTNPTSTGSTD